MPVEMDTEWAALDGDEIVLKRPTEAWLVLEMERLGLSTDDYDIVAFPERTPGFI